MLNFSCHFSYITRISPVSLHQTSHYLPKAHLMQLHEPLEPQTLNHSEILEVLLQWQCFLDHYDFIILIDLQSLGLNSDQVQSFFDFNHGYEAAKKLRHFLVDQLLVVELS